ncbi:MAG TPA: methyltransferase domain-containing protein [Solirubrobacteraceae bacterium]|nr:methyltransferase domain-containing protein [Solirubrobacteraceae bacterium]
MRRLIVLALLAIAAAALWSRRTAPSRVRAALAPRPGETILEVGPGAGQHAVAVAGRLAPGGTLEVLDARREPLDRTLRRAAEHRVEGVVATQADAGAMPYADASIDGAYVVAEPADGAAALRELHRVVRPGGRVVVGRALRECAEAAGFRFEGRSGGPLGYVARLGRD